MSEKSVLELDVTNAYEQAIGSDQGLDPDHVAGLAGRITRHYQEIEDWRGDEVGFMELPYDTETADTIKQKAAELREWCRNFVVLGIGGSALGNIATHGALNHAFHNLLPADHPGRMGGPRIFVLDNVDPALLADFLAAIEGELDATVFNVITKSGSTAETMSEFLFFRDLLRRNGLEPREHIIATTDPEPQRSLLRRIARADGYFTLPIPANVGGRFSVLSAVGLLSAAVGGIDIEEMLDAASAMDDRCRTPELPDNPAALYAAIQYLFYEDGKPISVLMPYGSALSRLADWFCQLWAESLGKRDGLHEKDVFVGPTPVGAVGVTDQHSVMQLFQDGRFDKVVTLVEVEKLLPSRDLAICEGGSEPELGYLADHTFGELFGSELAATRAALRDKERPNIVLRIPRVNAHALGELFMFFEYAVTYMGCLLDVNTFNQPGVELGKQYTYGLMGRQGYQPPKGQR